MDLKHIVVVDDDIDVNDPGAKWNGRSRPACKATAT